MKKYLIIDIAAAVLIICGFLAWKYFIAKKAAPPPAATVETREEKKEKTAPSPEEKKVEPKSKIERRGQMKITSLTPQKIASDYKAELTVLAIAGENFGTLPELWIGEFRVAPDALVSTEKGITIRSLRLYGTGKLWPKKWTVTVKRSDGQIATTTLTVGSGIPWKWLLAIIAIILVVIMCIAIFLIPKLWKKLTKPARTAPLATTGHGGTP